MFYKEKIGKNKSCIPELRKLIVWKYAQRDATMASVAADLGFLKKCFLMLLKVITAIGHAIICIKKKTTRKISKIEERATCRTGKYDSFLSKTEINKSVSAKLTYQV